jgi:hypothetical protein
VVEIDKAVPGQQALRGQAEIAQTLQPPMIISGHFMPSESSSLANSASTIQSR